MIGASYTGYILWVKCTTSAECKTYSNSQVLGYGHLPEKWCKRVDFYKIWSLGDSARDCGFASKRPWPALEGSWLARDEVQGLGVELWSGCSRVVVGEVLVAGAIRPPHEWFLGALEQVLQSGRG